MKKVEEIKKSALKDLEKAEDLKTLEAVKVKYLGRKGGELVKILRSLKDLPLQEKRNIGPLAQAFKKEFEQKIEEKFQQVSLQAKLVSADVFDITKPGSKIKSGHLHPLTKVEDEIKKIFISMNFSVIEGPEIEDEYHNFDALNIPPHHPARDAWNTFWIKDTKLKTKNSKLLLRTHTSPVQIRYMEKNNPPFQIIVPGTVYRYEATDQTHDIQFKQLEGLMVGKDISLANFKYVIEVFLKRFFGPKIQFKILPSYYPFVEPGVDVAIKWRGKWLEVAGAGMVHPKVFKAVKYNPYEWQGFAFGFGLNRLAMIKYNIPDIRLFNSGDLRFIEQF